MPSLTNYYISSPGAITSTTNTVIYNNGGTTNLNHALGTVFSLNANGTSTTIGHLNIPSGRYSFELHLQWISGTITWPSSWTKGDAAPSTTGGYVITGTTVDGGISWKISVLAIQGIVTDGLVLHLDAGNYNSYPGTGTTWTDLAGSNNGTFLGDTNYTNDKDGGLVFDGTDDAVLFGNVLNDTIAGTDKKFTISVWLKTGSTVPGFFFSKYGDSNHNESQRQIVFRILDVGGTPRLESFAMFRLTVSNFRGYYANSTVIEANTIYNFVLSYDGAIDSAGRFGLYINGTSQTTSVNITSGAWSDIQPGDAQLTLGGAYGTSGPLAYDFQGTIYQVMVHNRNLSAAEINQNFQATRGRFGI